MTLSLSSELQAAVVSAIADKVEEGSINTRAFIEIRSGTRPKSAQSPTTNTTLLAVVNLGNPNQDIPSFSVRGTIITANNINEDSPIVASGTATWFRLYNKNNQSILDGDVGLLTSRTAELRLKTTSLIEGRVVKISSMAIGYT